MRRINRRQVLQGFAVGSLATGMTSMVGAQSEPWPSRPIRWVVGLPPGGSADPLTRAIADQLSKRLN